MQTSEARMPPEEETVSAEALGWKYTWHAGSAALRHCGGRGVDREEVGGDEAMEK